MLPLMIRSLWCYNVKYLLKYKFMFNIIRGIIISSKKYYR